MPDRKPYTGPTTLVLAFDIGTTNSAVSYCILRQGHIPEIHQVARFPGQERGRGGAKVPSILYYDGFGNVGAIGSAALAEDVIGSAEDEGWIKAERWKLRQHPKRLAYTHIKDDDIPLLPPGKSVVDVLTDSTNYLFQCARTYIKERHIGFDWESVEDSIEFVFTHPNGWENEQQQQYRQAIEHAGLVPSSSIGRSRVHMIPEGEASLRYCLSGLPDKSANSEPQGAVVIDAGGGIIDLSMHAMKFDPLSFEEIAPAECMWDYWKWDSLLFNHHPHFRLPTGFSLCDTPRGCFVTKLVFSSRVVMQVSSLRIRPTEKLQGSRHSSPEEITDLAHEFDETTKLAVGSADNPTRIQIGEVRYNNPQYNIRRGFLELSGEDATGLLKDSLKAIITAFERQLRFATEKITTKTLQV